MPDLNQDRDAHAPGRRIGRRILLRDLGLVTVGAALGGVTAACSGGNSGGPTDGTVGPDAAATVGTGGWHRVDLGFVSAFAVVRAGEAAVVDTGTEGSAGDIAAVLEAAGAAWSEVGHVVLTHRHPDHVGSLPAVLERAPDAAAYAGAGDIPHISAPRELTAVGDGDTVLDLEIVETPGHTPGHISVLDPSGDGVLVAGDALTSADGRVTGPDPEFTDDMARAGASVSKLARLDFDTVLVGHGPPVEGGARDQVARLADSR